MNIRVEFFGIPRRRAGVAETVVRLNSDEIRLGDVLVNLASRFPALAADCFRGERLRKGVAVNLDGRRFLTDPDTRLQNGDCLLVLSADGGG
jgi:molybdopterin converting factor small subunit